MMSQLMNLTMGISKLVPVLLCKLAFQRMTQIHLWGAKLLIANIFHHSAWGKGADIFQSSGDLYTSFAWAIICVYKCLLWPSILFLCFHQFLYNLCRVNSLAFNSRFSRFLYIYIYIYSLNVVLVLCSRVI